MNRRLTDLQLERFNAESFSPEEKAKVAAVLAASPADAEALRLLRADDAAYFTTHPPAAFVAKVAPAPKKSWLPWLGALGFAVAAAVTLVVSQGRSGGANDDFGVKGDVAWRVTAETRVLAAGSEVRGGEALSFQVTAPRETWVAVVSHAPDGWFVYAPASAVKIGQSLLPVGAKLDDTRGVETLYLLSSDAPFDAEEEKWKLEKGQAPTVGVESLPFSKP